MKNGKRRFKNGEWRTENGEQRTKNRNWRAENGELRTENGGQGTENGERGTKNEERRMENGKRRRGNEERITDTGGQRMKEGRSNLNYFLLFGSVCNKTSLESGTGKMKGVAETSRENGCQSLLGKSSNKQVVTAVEEAKNIKIHIYGFLNRWCVS
nr:unnamed protein product [Callosobruchus chinensis]